MGLVYGDILLMILDFYLTSFIVNSQEFGIYNCLLILLTKSDCKVMIFPNYKYMIKPSFI